MSIILRHRVRQRKEPISPILHPFTSLEEAASRKRRPTDAADVAPSTLPLSRRRFDPVLQSTGASQMSKMIFKCSFL